MGRDMDSVRFAGESWILETAGAGSWERKGGEKRKRKRWIRRRGVGEVIGFAYDFVVVGFGFILVYLSWCCLCLGILDYVDSEDH